MSIANEIPNLILQLQQQHLRERSLKLLSDFLLQVIISSSLPFILSVFFSGFFSFLLRKKRVNWDFYEVGLSQLWQNFKCQRHLLVASPTQLFVTKKTVLFFFP